MPMQMDSPGSGQLSQVCQGSFPPQPWFPHPPTDPGRRLGGGSVTRVPSAHYRRPGNQRGSPARPHHGWPGTPEARHGRA